MKRRSVAPPVLPTANKAAEPAVKAPQRFKLKRSQVLRWIKRYWWGGLAAIIVLGILITSILPKKGDDFAIRRAPVYESGWSVSNHCQNSELTKETLDKSLALGVNFLLEHQRKAGNFDYEYDWKTGYNSDEDNEVRQAGALWGVALIFHDMMHHAQMEGVLSGKGANEAMGKRVLKMTAASIQRSLDFFYQHSKVLRRPTADDGYPSQMRYITYPGENSHQLGTQALTTLALIDFIRALGSPSDALAAGVTMDQVDQARTMLDEMLPFLVTQHTMFHGQDRFQAWDELVKEGQQIVSSGAWSGGTSEVATWWMKRQEVQGTFYSVYTKSGKAKGEPSPYGDGETLLATIKAARYLGPSYVHLWPFAVGTARAIHHAHVVEARKHDDDSDTTKGVYQWFSMSLFHLASVTFGQGSDFDVPQALETAYNADQFGKWLVSLGKWMIDVHDVLHKRKNTGYAYEGLTSAYSWASGMDGMEDATQKLACTIDQGMTRIIGWQVGMGAEKHGGDNWDGVKGLGGIQNGRRDSPLRIDVTQHQMHATILARRLLYGSSEWPWDGITVSEA